MFSSYNLKTPSGHRQGPPRLGISGSDGCEKGTFDGHSVPEMTYVSDNLQNEGKAARRVGEYLGRHRSRQTLP